MVIFSLEGASHGVFGVSILSLCIPYSIGSGSELLGALLVYNMGYMGNIPSLENSDHIIWEIMGKSYIIRRMIDIWENDLFLLGTD